MRFSVFGTRFNPLSAPGLWVFSTLLLIGAADSATFADVIHLKSGGSIEGEILERTEDGYRVRTVVGTMTVHADSVERVEQSPSPFAEYDRHRAKTPDQPAALCELADWCDEQGLKSQARAHRRRAIELDPDFEPARTALGYVRVGGIWVDARSVRDEASEDTAETDRGDETSDGSAAEDEDPEKVVAAVQARWRIQIQAIRKNMLESRMDRLVEDGRQRLLEIQDPLAILPLVRVLSDGNWHCRDVLVQMLDRFPHDEATLNLAAMSLVDNAEDVRRRALLSLKKRKDPRVSAYFRGALKTDSETVVRRAAVALGSLEDASAVRDLIAALKVWRRKTVEVPVRRYFAGCADSFGNPTRIELGPSTIVHYSPVLGVPVYNSMFATFDSEFRVKNVTVYRTEVLDALKRITGENFGFDDTVWTHWYEEQAP